ncbi:NACHT domain-containing protein [Streptomyces sp. NPDC055055]
MAATGYMVRQLSRGGLQVSDTAGLAAVGLAVVAGLVAVVALRKQAQANTATFADASLVRGWAATLARQVEAGEGAVRRQLLGDDTERINLVYRLHPGGVRPAAAPGAGRLFTDGGTAGPGGPVLPDIVAFYRQTRPERLVITGVGGAGKTVSALELLLGLIGGRSDDHPVPVRVPLSRWNTQKQSLPQLLEARLVEAYDWPVSMAAGLVGQGMVLPVLDGLDEVDPPRPDGTPDPAAPRAATVVEALNRYQRGRDAGPVILTCRTAHYDTLHPRTVVVDAARIEVEPVGPADAVAYLAGRARDEARWEPLTDHLAAEPQGMLSGVLSTPWRLGLAATVYHRDGDPGELLSLPDARAVGEHLLARYIPATVRLTHNPDGYTAGQVHRWLHRLSVHLDPVGTASNGGGTAAGTGGQAREGTDLLLHEFWPLAGRGRAPAANAALIALAVLAPVLLARNFVEWMLVALLVVSAVLTFWWDGPRRRVTPLRIPRLRRAAVLAGIVVIMAWIVPGVPDGIASGITGGVSAGTASGVLVGAGWALYLPSRGAPRVVPVILSVFMGVYGGLAAAAGALSVGFFAAVSGGGAGTDAAGYAGGAVSGIVSAIMFGVRYEPDAGRGARAPIRDDAFLGVTLGMIAGAAAGIAVGLGSGPARGIAFGIVLGLAVGLVLGADASRWYLVFLALSRGKLPFRLGRFLDWAVGAGLLRHSGAGFQYRHREFQHWLRHHPQPSQ